MKIQSYIVPITFNALDSQEILSPQISLYSPYLYNNNNNNKKKIIIIIIIIILISMKKAQDQLVKKIILQ